MPLVCLKVSWWLLEVVSKYLVFITESILFDCCCLPVENAGCKNAVKSVTISSACEKFLAPQTEQCQSRSQFALLTVGMLESWNNGMMGLGKMQWWFIDSAAGKWDKKIRNYP